MRLLPSEQDRLILFLAAELARRRRGRGLRLSQAEATALIADETMELARDGLAYARGRAARLRAARPRPTCSTAWRELVDRHRARAGVRRRAPADRALDPVAPRPPARPDRRARAELARRRRARSGSRTLARCAIAVTSHFHFFETNRALRFDRRAAWGMRLAVAPGTKVVFPPGEPREVRLVPFGGARVIRGHGGLVDGAAGRARGARRRARAGPRAGVRRCRRLSAIALGDGDLVGDARARRRRAARTRSCPAGAAPTATASACGPSAAASTSRSSAAWCSTRVLGVRRTSIGIRDGRVVRDRPGRQPGHDGRHRRRPRRRRPRSSTRAGMIVTPGAVDSPHALALAPARRGGRSPAASRRSSRRTTARSGTWARTRPPACASRGRRSRDVRSTSPSSCARRRRGPRASRSRSRAGGAGLKIHEDVAAGPQQLRCALDVADRHDVQLAIHTDGLNEALRAADTARVLDGRTAHLYHIEGVGGGHAPDLLTPGGARAAAHLVHEPDGALRGRRRGRAPCDGRRRAPARAGLAAPATPPSCARACGPGRWPPRASCTTSA